MRPASRPGVYAVSSRKRLAPGARTLADEILALEGWLEAVIGAGADIVQIRERDLNARTLQAVVRRAVLATEGRQTAVLVSERADVALAARADGVHLPADALPVGEARRLMPGRIVGRSVHGVDAPGESDTPDYVLFGTLFPTRSKEPSAPTAGLEGLGAAVRRWPCPVVAIGGISIDAARACVQRGASGVAAIGLFLPPGTEPESLGPEAAVRQLARAMAAPPVP